MPGDPDYVLCLGMLCWRAWWHFTIFVSVWVSVLLVLLYAWRR